MNEPARAALAAIKAEYPEWDITFLGGYHAHWRAWRIFDSPAALITIETYSARALRARLFSASHTMIPRNAETLKYFP